MTDTCNQKKQKLVNRLAYLGTGFLIVTPVAIDMTYMPLFAIMGLILITPQVWQKKQWNLVILNFTGIIGYSWTQYWRLVDLPFYPF